MTLIVLDEAELEFLEAVNYYEEAAGLGARFRDEVSAGVAWILENPRVLRLRPGNYYRLNLRVFPYYLPYILRGENIWLLAVLQWRRHNGNPVIGLSGRQPSTDFWKCSCGVINEGLLRKTGAAA
jgi:plasmid stabilization system protein ParE